MCDSVPVKFIMPRDERLIKTSYIDSENGTHQKLDFRKTPFFLSKDCDKCGMPARCSMVLGSDTMTINRVARKHPRTLYQFLLGRLNTRMESLEYLGYSLVGCFLLHS